MKKKKKRNFKKYKGYLKKFNLSETLYQPTLPKVIITIILFSIFLNIITPMPEISNCPDCNPDFPETCEDCPVIINFFHMDLDISHLGIYGIITMFVLYLIEVFISYVLACLIVHKMVLMT